MPFSHRLHQTTVAAVSVQALIAVKAARRIQAEGPDRRYMVLLAACQVVVVADRRSRHTDRSHPNHRRSSRIVSLRSISVSDGGQEQS